MLKDEIIGFFNDENASPSTILNNDLRVFIDGFSTKTLEDIKKDLEHYNKNLSFDTKIINKKEVLINVKSIHENITHPKILLYSF
ncbi:hypothetical protein AB836_01805 [Rickettsiales bacterium (ex Bugula neritina AB1)]|nr:hypothetical protein AB836_01805 [Rickettsiales bacterium (ex Bugula neritina AB1)]